MSSQAADRLERRVLVLAPVGRDAALIEEMLGREGIGCAACSDHERLLHELAHGAAALLITEEALGELDGRLPVRIAHQPPWSDIPVLLLTRHGADSVVVGEAIETLGNVTLIERPARVGALVSAVRSALRARERQYHTRAYLEERMQADQRKDQFLATLAHELRNPLAPIRNALGILRLSGQGHDAEGVCEIIDRQVSHMVRLVDDLMEVSRITRGTIELRRTAVDLAAAIGVAAETSSPLMEAAGHRLEVRLPEQPLVVDADPMRLAQIFSNLLNNAAKYTNPGGSIAIEARQEGEAAVVSVIDNGIGISPDALSAVFEMFSQIKTHAGRTQTGLGIGLTLARSLAQIHGGSITAFSEGEGRGSRFTVRLPLQKGQPALSGSPAGGQPAMRALPRILVVDDNRDAADSLGALLQLIGAADVRVAHDGHGALEAFEDFQPGIVVLDLGMPGIDGFEVARRIRSRPDAQGTVLIALTGWGQEKDRRSTQAAGFDHHLVKPVDIETINAVLAQRAA